MRVRRAQHVAEGDAGQDDVADIAAAAPEQARILEPGHALTDRKLTHDVSLSLASAERRRTDSKAECVSSSVRCGRLWRVSPSPRYRPGRSVQIARRSSAAARPRASPVFPESPACPEPFGFRRG